MYDGECSGEPTETRARVRWNDRYVTNRALETYRSHRERNANRYLCGWVAGPFSARLPHQTTRAEPHTHTHTHMNVWPLPSPLKTQRFRNRARDRRTASRTARPRRDSPSSATSSPRARSAYTGLRETRKKKKTLHGGFARALFDIYIYISQVSPDDEDAAALEASFAVAHTYSDDLRERTASPLVCPFPVDASMPRPSRRAPLSRARVASPSRALSAARERFSRTGWRARTTSSV